MWDIQLMFQYLGAKKDTLEKKSQCSWLCECSSVVGASVPSRFGLPKFSRGVGEGKMARFNLTSGVQGKGKPFFRPL